MGNFGIYKIECGTTGVIYIGSTSVSFKKRWENARGCKIEHEVALQYGLEVIYES